jgi:YARHG domain
MKSIIKQCIVYFLWSWFGTICACANDIPIEFVVSQSNICRGSDFKLGKADISELQGVWSFGESESEWSVIIIAHNEGMIVQTSSSFFSEEKQNFMPIYSAMSTQKLENGTFKIAKPNREQGHYNALLIEPKSTNPKTDKKTKMILLDGNSLDSRKGARREAGLFNRTLKERFGDQYELSCAILDEDVMKSKSVAELTLMRNTIFARYGMIFSDPALKKHFDKQKWYRPWKVDVTDCITELEWINIRTIQKYEKLIKRE